MIKRMIDKGSENSYHRSGRLQIRKRRNLE
jgi:hypothetical protein